MLATRFHSSPSLDAGELMPESPCIYDINIAMRDWFMIHVTESLGIPET